MRYSDRGKAGTYERRIAASMRGVEDMRSPEKRVSSPQAPGNETVERTGSGTPGSSFSGLVYRLFAPVDVASLVFFRIAFGLIMLWEVFRYFNYGWIGRYYIDPIFHFSYYGFGWVQPWAGVGMYLHFLALGVLAVCIALGLFYRVAAVLFFLGFSYVFLLDQTQYLNHFYFVCLVSFLLILVPANRAFSLDARRWPRIKTYTVPLWAPAILAFQMGVVYFFGGIAKLNADWLRGEPMSMWLSAGSDHPVLGWLFGHPYSGYFFSYGGLLLDLFIVPFLLWRRTRLAAFLMVTAFHLSNAFMFQIGIFPWFAIAATAMFFPPSWPRRFFHFLHGMWDPAAGHRRERERSRQYGSTPEGDAEAAHDERDEPVGAIGASSGVSLGISPGANRGSALGFFSIPGRRRSLLVALLAVFVAVQLLMPFRHFAYPGNVSWTEEGHHFAWHMKLRSAEGLADFRVTEPRSGEVWNISPERYLTERQVQKMSYQPDMILQFVHALEAEFRSAGYEDVEVRAGVLKSMNGREPQRLIDPEVDLTEQSRSLTPADWIVPLEKPL